MGWRHYIHQICSQDPWSSVWNKRLWDCLWSAVFPFPAAGTRVLFEIWPVTQCLSFRRGEKGYSLFPLIVSGWFARQGMLQTLWRFPESTTGIWLLLGWWYTHYAKCQGQEHFLTSSSSCAKHACIRRNAMTTRWTRRMPLKFIYDKPNFFFWRS